MRLLRRWGGRALLAFLLALPAAANGAEPADRGAGPSARAAEPRPGAEPSARSARLQWKREAGAEGCISGEELAAALQRRLRRSTIGGPEADVTLDGTIAPAAEGAGWKAWIVVRDRAERSIGTREVASVEASCRALDEALLLVLSTIVDPSLALDSAPPAPPKAAGARRPGDETSWHLAAGVVGAAGFLPGLSAGVLARAGVRPFGGPVFELEGANWFGKRADSDRGGATISALYLGVSLCWVPFERGRWLLGACVGGQAGALRARATEFEGTNLAPSRALAGVTARGEARFTFAAPFFLRFSLGAAVPLVRDRFFFDAQGNQQISLFRLSPAAGVAALEGGVTFR